MAASGVEERTQQRGTCRPSAWRRMRSATDSVSAVTSHAAEVAAVLERRRARLAGRRLGVRVFLGFVAGRLGVGQLLVRHARLRTRLLRGRQGEHGVGLEDVRTSVVHGRPDAGGSRAEAHRVEADVAPVLAVVVQV